jgi:hypothetical protein
MALTVVPIVPVSEAWRSLPELYSPNCLEQLSEKGCRPRSEREFSQYTEDKTAERAPFRVVRRGRRKPI